MKVIEGHRKDLEPKKSKKYIYKCYHCGSVLEVDSKDIHSVRPLYEYEEEWGDIEEYFTCPVCGRKRLVFAIKLHHLKSLRKLFNKKYK